MNSSKENRSIGFIGLGDMGHAMASRLIPSVSTLHVYDINPQASQSLVSGNTAVANNPADIGKQCEIVFLCLPDETAVESVLFGVKGLFESSSNTIETIVDTSTLDVERTQSIAKRVSNLSTSEYCDCPVTGLPKRARTGELTAMFGGSATSFEQLNRIISQLAKNVLYCGDVGQGQLTKAFNNVIYDINTVAFCELLPLAIKRGLAPDILERVLTSGSGSSFASEHFLPRILKRQFTDDFSMQAAYKDIININNAKLAVNADTPLFDAMRAHYEQSLEAGLGNEPKSALIKLYEQALDVTVKGQSIKD